MAVVAALVATTETPDFVAFTVQLISAPTSPADKRRVAAVAPMIGTPERSH